jgi:uncharacterized protein (TIGR02217 family)
MFYDIELDACPAYGWQGGPGKEVLIKRLVSGREKRKPQSSLFLRTYILPYNNIPNGEYVGEILTMYMVMDGATDSFKIKDWSDFEAIEQPLGLSPAGSTPIQFSKTYVKGAKSKTRDITKPGPGAIVYQNGVEKTGTYSSTTGLFTPTTAWTPAAVITWTGTFFVPVRFDQMSLQFSIDNRTGQDYATNGSVSLIEVYGE